MALDGSVMGKFVEMRLQNQLSDPSFCSAVKGCPNAMSGGDGMQLQPRKKYDTPTGGGVGFGHR